ncbi:MAG: twin-arginine translocase TatA/TatE family subunit [Planctomycetes bacterium]|nr:twin-arginine translocase TatA/TatE family subunit [Planctomycetota bacterium]
MNFLAADPVLLVGFIDIGPGEMVLLGIVAVLLFGKRLPEVGRSIGKGMAEFKRGLMGLGSEEPISKIGGFPGLRAVQHEEVDDYVAPSAPKFEAPSVEPSVPEPETSAHPDATARQ